MAVEAIIQLDAAGILAFWDLGCLHTIESSVLALKETVLDRTEWTAGRKGEPREE